MPGVDSDSAPRALWRVRAERKAGGTFGLYPADGDVSAAARASARTGGSPGWIRGCSCFAPERVGGARLASCRRTSRGCRRGAGLVAPPVLRAGTGRGCGALSPRCGSRLEWSLGLRPGCSGVAPERMASPPVAARSFGPVQPLAAPRCRPASRASIRTEVRIEALRHPITQKGTTSVPFCVMARPRGFEPLTSASGGQRSIQLSYGRKGCNDTGGAAGASSHI